MLFQLQNGILYERRVYPADFSEAFARLLIRIVGKE